MKNSSFLMGKMPYLWIDFVVVLPFVNVSRRPISCKQSNKKHIVCMISINVVLSIQHIQICNQMQFFGVVDHFKHPTKFFFCELEKINQSNTIYNLFSCSKSPYPHPWHSCQTPPVLDLYPSMDRRKWMSVNI
jgi:hypothetical protein